MDCHDDDRLNDISSYKKGTNIKTLSIIKNVYTGTLRISGRCNYVFSKVRTSYITQDK